MNDHALHEFKQQSIDEGEVSMAKTAVTLDMDEIVEHLESLDGDDVSEDDSDEVRNVVHGLEHLRDGIFKNTPFKDEFTKLIAAFDVMQHLINQALD